MKRTALALVIAASLSLGVASALIHMPAEVSRRLFGRPLLGEPVYDDFYATAYNGLLLASCSGGQPWLNAQRALEACAGARFFPVPYVDYQLKQAPLYSILASSAYFVMSLVGARPSTPEGALVFYSFEALTSVAFLVAAALALAMTYERLGAGGEWAVAHLAYVTIPMYAVYSMDTLTLLLVALSLLYAAEGRHSASVVFAGLAASANPIAFVLLASTLYYYLIGRVEGLSLTALAVGLSPYIIFAATSPRGMADYFNSLISAGSNNGVSILLTPWLGPSAYGAWVGAWLAFNLLLMAAGAAYPRAAARYEALALSTSIALCPVFPPQSMLLALPLLSPQLRGKGERAVLQAADVLNALIIPLWFKDASLRYHLNNLLGLNLPVYDNPLGLDSPIQWIAQLRNALLLALLALKLLSRDKAL